jgi:hypothetical protein
VAFCSSASLRSSLSVSLLHSIPPSFITAYEPTTSSSPARLMCCMTRTPRPLSRLRPSGMAALFSSPPHSLNVARPTYNTFGNASNGLSSGCMLWIVFFVRALGQFPHYARKLPQINTYPIQATRLSTRQGGQNSAQHPCSIFQTEPVKCNYTDYLRLLL